MWYLFDLTPSNWCKTDAHFTDFGKGHACSLRDQASNCLKRLPAGSISTWKDLTNLFLAQFFPPGKTSKLYNNILMFQQHQGESLSESWTRFKDLIQKLPHHGIDLWLQFQIFYDHVNPITRRTIDQADGGKLRDKNDEESWALYKMSRDVITIGLTMQIPLLYQGEYSQWRERFMNYLEEQTDGEAMINSIQNEKKTRKIDRLARSLLIQGLSNDIYSLIDINETAKDLWDALERRMRGSEYGEKDRKATILYEYETFKANEGEQLLDT
nr:zinc finger, CCHC-type [Tanacetum cinerariifolium]